MVNRIAVLVFVALLLLAGSCDVLQSNVATSGPKRYKSEVSAMGLNMKNDIEQAGGISPATRKKFDGIMAKWKDEMSGKGSYHKLQAIEKELQETDANPNQAFNNNQQIQLYLMEMSEILKTEVQ